MHGSDGMLKTGVQCTGIDEMCETKLFDPPQPLKVRVLDKVEYQVRRNCDKSVNRIVYYLSFICHALCMMVIPQQS